MQINCHTQDRNIHVIGDSHSFSYKLIPNITIHHIGSVTMHRVGRDGTSIVNFRRLGIRENDVVILTFGEIDVRCHILKQKDLYFRDEQEIIDTLSTEYCITILDNLNSYKNLNIIIASITPPTNQTYNLDFPFYGNIIKRVAVTKALNMKLNEMAKKFGFAFLDSFDEYSDNQGILLKEKSDGSVHINSNCYHHLQNKLLPILDDINKK